MSLVEIHEIEKGFTTPDGKHERVLSIAELKLEEGEQLALSGGSGSGKTTLLHILAGMVLPDSGQVLVAGRDLTTLSEAARDRFRAETVGYVFQRFHLLEGYTALENVLLGMLFGPGADTERARELLVRLDLADRLHHKPSALSVGQQQRVAIARALACRPRLVLADEPTGNLDAARARTAMDLLCGLCSEQGAALIVVSHDRELLSSVSRQLDLKDINSVYGPAHAGDNDNDNDNDSAGGQA